METYLGFEFRESKNTGGKAGKGFNKTTSFHVTNLSLCSGKYFPFKKGDSNSKDEAIRNAKIWIETVLIEKGICPYCADADCTSDHK